MSIEFLAIDTETTGLDATKNQIIDICLLLIDGEFEIKDELHVFAFPDADAIIEPGAVKVNGYAPELWREKGALTQAAMFEEVYKFVKNYKKLKLIAHNVVFDGAFLKQLFEKHCGPDKIPYNKIMDYHSLDTMGISMFLDYVQTGKARKSYRLASLTSDYGIEHSEAHTARSDIHSTIALLRAMKNAVIGTLAVAPGITKESANVSKIIVNVDTVNNVWEFHHGMHKGRIVSDIAKEDPTYIRNVLTFPDLSPAQRAYLESVYSSQ